MDPYGKQTRWVDIASGGPKDVEFALRTMSAGSIRISPMEGSR